MNHFEPVDGRLDGSKPDLALLELEAGTLDAPLRDEWMALVNRSPAAQLAYLGYLKFPRCLAPRPRPLRNAEIFRKSSIPSLRCACCGVPCWRPRHR